MSSLSSRATANAACRRPSCDGAHNSSSNRPMRPSSSQWPKLTSGHATDTLYREHSSGFHSLSGGGEKTRPARAVDSGVPRHRTGLPSLSMRRQVRPGGSPSSRRPSGRSRPCRRRSWVRQAEDETEPIQASQATAGRRLDCRRCHRRGAPGRHRPRRPSRHKRSSPSDDPDRPRRTTAQGPPRCRLRHPELVVHDAIDSEARRQIARASPGRR